MYTIGDFLIRTKNAYMARKREMETPYSNVANNIAKVLVKEGMLKSVEKKTEKNRSYLKISLSYVEGMPVLQEIKIISTPSVHKYKTRRQINRTMRDLGFYLISTSKGIMTDQAARKQGLGGEVLAQIY